MWQIASSPPDTFFDLHPNYNSYVLSYLWQRGIVDSNSINSFLNYHIPYNNDPFLLKGMREAADVFADSIMRREKIIVFGDYDADGVTSSALIRLFYVSVFIDIHGLFSSDNHNMNNYIPNRSQGYGMSKSSCDDMLSKFPNPDLVITVDNGIRCAESVSYLKSLFIKTIVTDHHHLSSDINDYPHDAVAVINPHQPDCLYPNKHLAGVGVAYKLCCATFSVLKQRGYLSSFDDNFCDNFLDLVAIGTVADMMFMGDFENRFLVKNGLDKIRSQARFGIEMLAKSPAHGKYPILLDEVDTLTIGFSIAPLINAASRMGDVMDAFNLLISNDYNFVASLSDRLISLNKERKLIQKSVKKSLLGSEIDLTLPTVCVIVHDMPSGITGLIASDLARTYRKPTFVFHQKNDVLVASARSFGESVNLMELLISVSDTLVSWGGHDYAAGMTLKVKDYDQFVERINKYFEENYLQQTFYKFDFLISLSEVNYNLYRVLKLLQPLSGSQFGNPSFVVNDVKVKNLKYWGESQSHTKFDVVDERGYSLHCNIWNDSEKNISDGDIINVAFYIEETVDYITGKKYLRANVTLISKTSQILFDNKPKKLFIKPTINNQRLSDVFSSINKSQHKKHPF
jgi:single-stranded-DNA-specific exonuclease